MLLQVQLMGSLMFPVRIVRRNAPKRPLVAVVIVYITPSFAASINALY